MGRYLLTLLETSGGHEHTTRHLIEADTEQMVKYHYHRTLKDMGWSDAHRWGDKHTLEGYRGICTELMGINELDYHEWDVMERYLSKWPTV
jgi:hypothetical protein